MAIGMLLAHLLGDYVFQWDRLAYWKSREVKGAVVHGLLVTLVTLGVAMYFNPAWWPWAVFIGITHTAIDATQPLLLRRLAPGLAARSALPRYLLDQALHLAVIVYALAASGYLGAPAPIGDLLTVLQQNRLLAFLLAYVFLTIPSWILVEFVVYGLLRGSGPDLRAAPNRYVGAVERGLIATFVVLGQFLLVPLAALPRLILEPPQVRQSRIGLYVAELSASTLLAIGIGLALRSL